MGNMEELCCRNGDFNMDLTIESLEWCEWAYHGIYLSLEDFSNNNGDMIQEMTNNNLRLVMISQTRFSEEQLTWTPDMFVSKSRATHLEIAGFNQSRVKKTLLYEHVRTFEEKNAHTDKTNKQHDLGHLSLGIEVTSATVEFPRPGPGEFHYYVLLMKYGTDAL